jgi:Amt family ammonium transporter
MGLLSGSIPWFSMNVMGKKLRFFYLVDDCLGVYHTHLCAGALGGMMTGVLATPEGCAAFAITNPGGAIAGNWKQVWLQLVGALFIIGLNLFMTSIIMCFIKYVLRIPLRMSEAELEIGDDAVHGEEAYVFGDDFEAHRHLLAGHRRVPNNNDAELGVIQGQSLSSGEGDIAPAKEESTYAPTKGDM